METNENVTADRESAPPEEFVFSVGGFNSPNFRVEVSEGALFYKASYVGLRLEEALDGLDRDTWDLVQRALEFADENSRTTALSLIEAAVEPAKRPAYYLRFGFIPPMTPFPPIEPNWSELHAELDRIGVWNWQEGYLDSSVLDGTGWSLKIRWGDKAIQSGGRNSYPQAEDGTPSPYHSLIAAIRRQIGGRALF